MKPSGKKGYNLENRDESQGDCEREIETNKEAVHKIRLQFTKTVRTTVNQETRTSEHIPHLRFQTGHSLLTDMKRTRSCSRPLDELDHGELLTINSLRHRHNDWAHGSLKCER